MAAVATMDSIKARDHAYSHHTHNHDGPVSEQSKPHVPTSIDTPPGSAITPNPTLIWTPPSVDPSTSPVNTRKPLRTPPLVTPPLPTSSSTGSSMSFFARRGSLLPKSGDGQGHGHGQQSHHGFGRSHPPVAEEGIEMGPVKSVVVDTEKLREEQAMAKWRPSPPASPKSSPMRKPHTVINISPSLEPTSSKDARDPSPSPLGPQSPRSSDAPQAGPSSARPSRVMESVSDANPDVYNTESVLALRDVELAVDEDMLRSMEGRSRLNSRRVSVVPPPFPENSPFDDLAPRLISRRVRPLVLELIQALGHYIDAVWALRHPDQPCPWADPAPSSATTPPPSSTLTTPLELGASAAAPPTWRSKMVTAVQEGRRSGHVDDPPTASDVEFWESEVRYALKDVNNVVGIYKGAAWAFDTAMSEGRYGEVHAENVTAAGEHGGGLTRLLHDLEEALWGEAAPRNTDLAFELPIDFDPYALVVDDPMLQGNGRPQPSPSSQRSNNDPLQAAQAAASEGQLGAETPVSGDSDAAAAAAQRRVIKVNAWDAALNLDAFKKEGEEEVSLEELGRRRHQEWLESRKADDWAV